MKKYANVEKILEVKTASSRLKFTSDDGETTLQRFAKLGKEIKEEDGYLYVRARAISSRVNKNNDGWPSEELASAYSSFVGRPVFVDHNNDDVKRTRGVIVDSQLHVDDEEKTSSLDPYYSTAPDNHKPPTWIELLIEVDAETFPKLAEAVRKEDIDSVSMGANIQHSVCSVCDNMASIPEEFCNHVQQKGLTFEITSADGEKIRKKAYEDCYGIDFFEISFVFDPADTTALISEKTGKVAEYGLNFHDDQPRADETPYDERYYQDRLKAWPEFLAKFPGKDLMAPEWIPFFKEWRLNNRTGLASYVGKKLSKEGLEALKLSYPSLDQFVVPVGTQGDKAKDPNFVPQADQVTAPQEVDTLRDENVCPVCRAANMEFDPDGISRCPTCGHVQEPEPLNNPDLQLAQETDLRQDATDTTTEDGEPEAPANTQDQITFTPAVARKLENTQGVISEMFTTILTTESKDVADRILAAKKLARIEATLGTRFPINSNVVKALKEKNLAVTVEYPAIDRRVAVLEDAPILNLFAVDESAHKLKLKEFSEVPIVVEADTEEQAKEALEIIQAATPKRGDKKAEVTINIGDQKPQDAADSDEVVAEAPAVEEVVEAVEEAEEPVVEEEAPEDADVEAAVEEVDESELKETKLMAAFKLADTSVEMGILDQAQKMIFIAELEEETVEALEARQKTLDSVKNAGLRKNATSATAGIKSVPRLSRAGNLRVAEAIDLDDEVEDYRLFL